VSSRHCDTDATTELNLEEEVPVAAGDKIEVGQVRLGPEEKYVPSRRLEDQIWVRLNDVDAYHVRFPRVDQTNPTEPNPSDRCECKHLATYHAGLTGKCSGLSYAGRGPSHCHCTGFLTAQKEPEAKTFGEALKVQEQIDNDDLREKERERRRDYLRDKHGKPSLDDFNSTRWMTYSIRLENALLDQQEGQE
jgi:hypothetical protein